MMSFCKKSVHSFLGLTVPMNNNLDACHNIVLDHHHHQKPKLCLPVLTCATSGLGLITATDIDAYKTPPNVLESTTFKSSSSSSSPPSSPPSPPSVVPAPLFKKDPGGIGFIDDVGGGVNGLMSCTESLGFESCDERRVDDEIDELCSRTSTTTTTKVNNWRKNNGERKVVKKFPPPLSSLNHNGQPSFFLRPLRKDGRLELTEVRLDRPEILRASRKDGRLRLHLIRDDDDEEEEEEEEDDDDDSNQEFEEQEYERRQKQELDNIDQEDEQEEEVLENEVEEEIAGEWRFPVTGEGFRRCHELVTHHHHHDCHHQHDYHHGSHHHHNLHVWSQHCVTTR